MKRKSVRLKPYTRATVFSDGTVMHSSPRKEIISYEVPDWREYCLAVAVSMWPLIIIVAITALHHTICSSDI